MVENQTTNEEQQPMDKMQSNVKGSKVNAFMLVGVLVLFCAGAFFVYSFNKKIDVLANTVKSGKIVKPQNINKLLSKFESLSKSNNELQLKIDELGRHHVKATRLFNAKITALENQAKANQSDNIKLKLMEIKSGLEVASWILVYQYNVTACINLLEALDHKASSITKFEKNIRQSLARDILALKRIQSVDQAGLFAKIEAVQELIPQLTIVQTRLYKPEASVEIPAVEGWRGYVDYGLQSLKRLVAFKRHDKEIPPLLSPTNRIVIDQNLELLLGQMQWSIIYRKQAIYNSLIKKTISWILVSFAKDDPINQSVLKSLDELSEININPELPSLTDSIQAVNTSIEQYINAPSKMIRAPNT